VAKAEAKVKTLTAAVESGTSSVRPVTPAARKQTSTSIELDPASAALNA